MKKDKIGNQIKPKGCFLNNLKKAINDVNLAEQGQIKLKSAEQLLKEL